VLEFEGSQAVLVIFRLKCRLVTVKVQVRLSLRLIKKHAIKHVNGVQTLMPEMVKGHYSMK
jgi:hypothetical protein